MKGTLIGVGGSLFSFGSGWLGTVSTDELLRWGTYVVGMAGGLVAIYWMNRINRIKMQREFAELCAACVRRHRAPPGQCELPSELRPPDCPKRRTERLESL
jgi:hypothetical protein